MLFQVTMNGDCFFESVLAQIDIPSDLPFSASDLRRLVIFRICEDPSQFLTHQTALSIQADLDFRYFSFKTWLRYMSIPRMWADANLMQATCKIFSLRGTLVLPDKVAPLHFCHSGPSSFADLLLIYNGLNHFTSTGEFYYY